VMIYVLYVLGPNYSLYNNYSTNKVLFSVLILLYPLVDLLRVFILRIKAGQSPFQADKNHIHHFFLKKVNGLFPAFLIVIFIIILTQLILFNIAII